MSDSTLRISRTALTRLALLLGMAGLAAIGALWIAELMAALRSTRRLVDVLTAVLIPAALILAPIFGFGTSERVVLTSHIIWLISLTGSPPKGDR